MSASAALPERARSERQDAASRALARGCEHLLSLQQEQGFWKAELETNVTMEAEDLLLRQFLGIGSESLTRQTAAWIRSRQRPDGSFATFHGGPAELSTTIEAWLGLRLAGDPPSATLTCSPVLNNMSISRAGGFSLT
jgi:squalene-hopene/tetraprenyl-beta-curcumene cyclase